MYAKNQVAAEVTTATAAQIVGIGYEGLRTYLKRGLLGSSGLMPSFVGRDTEAPDLSAARAKWRRFGVVDLCLMRLAKLLMDAGLDFASANSIASNSDVRRIFQGRQPSDGLVLTWSPFKEFMVFDKDDLVHLTDRLADLQQLHAVNTIIHLAPIWTDVCSQMPAVEVTAQADVATLCSASAEQAAAVVAHCSTPVLLKGDE